MYTNVQNRLETLCIDYSLLIIGLRHDESLMDTLNSGTPK